jgi:glycosyltransferase involved in cell wall biosynthesis
MGRAGLRIVLTSVHSWPEVRRGAERYVHELSSALQQGGHEVLVLSTGRPARDRVLGVPVRRYRSHGRHGFGTLRVEQVFGARAGARLAAARLDVWHATSTGDGAAAVALGRLRPQLRTVFTDHGFPVRASREQRGDARQHEAVVRGIGSYVCVSTAAGEWLQRDFGRRACVVPPGVDTDRFRPDAGRASRPTVLYSGALDEPRKGVRSLVEAVGRLPGVALWLVGPGRPDLAGLDTRHVEVCRQAAPDEMPALYRSAWVTALPATAEAFGMALVESLSCGTPVVVREDAGGPADVVTAATGTSYDGTGDGLTTALQEVLDNGRDLSACRARGEDFDWRRRVVPALEQLYTSTS